MTASSNSRPWLVEMSRVDTERWLKKSKVDGTFVIRKSESVEEGQVLSLM